MADGALMSRLLDAYGRPIKTFSEFVTPAWVVRAAAEQLKGTLKSSDAMAAEFRVMALRESVGLPGRVVGDRVSVRKPMRYSSKTDDAG